jgi:ABC-type Fe3+/spermidine/putrescine transport system ATPase subunit
MEASKTPMLELRDIYKSFGDVEVLKGISARIDKGELLTFVGPSGCGKTTLLRIVGGFTSATSGQVILDGEDMGKLPPNMRNTKMVFQSYALFPHMNVRKNIGFGLKLKKWPKEKMDTRVEELLSLVHMENLGDRSIDRISGGQQQRVALARALALEPKVLLLDEPLSNLDANLRVVMREEIRHIQERIGITTIFVTHDQYEAMSISDRLLVLHDGIIQQIGSPIDIYERPANEFIAGFVTVNSNWIMIRKTSGWEMKSCWLSGRKPFRFPRHTEPNGRIHSTARWKARCMPATLRNILSNSGTNRWWLIITTPWALKNSAKMTRLESRFHMQSMY